MEKLMNYTVKWLLGALFNLGACILLFFLIRLVFGWDFMHALMFGGFIQLGLMVPSYIREINIQPQGPPATLRGMNRYDVNDFSQFTGIKRMVEPEDMMPRKELTGLKELLFRRSIFQELSYAVLMIGISLTYYMMTY